jgi:hypothetical protein
MYVVKSRLDCVFCYRKFQRLPGRVQFHSRNNLRNLPSGNIKLITTKTLENTVFMRLTNTPTLRTARLRKRTFPVDRMIPDI